MGFFSTRRRRASEQANEADPAVAFGPKTAWMAFLDWSPTDVVALLALPGPRQISWAEAIDEASRQPNRVAVTPPIPGVCGDWVLVTGAVLLDHPPDISGWSDVSATEVQYFGTSPVVDAQVWKRALDGDLLRSFVWLGGRGEIVEWVGQPDATEVACGVPRDGAADAHTAAAVLDAAIDEDTVMRIAGAWSVDPTRLGDEPLTGRPWVASYR